MKCILLIVGLFTVLALVQAQEEEAASSSSDQSEEINSEIPDEPEQSEESGDHQPGNGHPAGKPPKRTKVWAGKLEFDFGK